MWCVRTFIFLLLLFYFHCYETHDHTNDAPVVQFRINIGTDNDDGTEGEGEGQVRRALRIKDEYPIKQLDALRIRGGNATDTMNYPYMAAVIINKKLWCAGTIVDENWVVTAAHCLNYVLQVAPLKSLKKFVKVRVGSSTAMSGGELVDVAGAIRHPKFEEEPVPHADVALLKLTQNLVMTRFVNVLKIHDGIVEPYAQSFITIAGWGARKGSETSFKDPTPDLLSARLKVRTRHYCIDAYQLVNGFQFTDDFFCASLRNGTRDACLFDAGAPAVQQNQLMGIMSFGPEKCGDETKPAVFIKAFYFRDFVMHTIAAYKTTSDVIEAMQQIDPGLHPSVHQAENQEEDDQEYKKIIEEQAQADRDRF